MSDDNAIIKELQSEFIDQTAFMLEECEEAYLKLSRPEARDAELTKIFRLAHSIKGSGGVAGFLDLSEFAHCVEDLLTILRARTELVNDEIISLLLRSGDAFKTRIQALRDGHRGKWDIEKLTNEIVEAAAFLSPGRSVSGSTGTVESDADIAAAMAADAPVNASDAASSPVEANETAPKQQKEVSLVRVDPTRIDAVLDLVGELVVIKGQLLEQSRRTAGAAENEILSLLDKTARELQDRTLAMRMTPLKPLFVRVQRIVRDLSLQLEKPVDLTLEGENIELDRSMIELLTDPLTHIVRNAIDHGLEKWEDRQGLGKSISGQIKLCARQTGGRIIIEIQDDGRGINKDRVLAKALEKGLVSPQEAEVITSDEIYQLIFRAGFSTAEKVTDVSGRGVGLDVVKSNIERLKGSVLIETEPGKGSTFRISLPLTTAITDAIIVVIQGRRFVVPMAGILEIVQLGEKDLHHVAGNQKSALIRGKPIALLPIGFFLDTNARALDVLTSEGQKGSPQVKAEATPMKTRERRLTALVIEHAKFPVGLLVDAVLGQSQVVIKSLGEQFKDVVGLAGASIMGDGKIALVLDIDALTNSLKGKAPISSSQELKAAG